MWSPICTFEKDTDDVRVIADATKKGVLRYFVIVTTNTSLTSP